MNLTVNGKPATIEGIDTLDVTRLLTELKVETPEYVTVELNGEILDRNNFETTVLKNNDIIEFLYFMGGGAD
jgi:sulfur carrier protein